MLSGYAVDDCFLGSKSVLLSYHHQNRGELSSDHKPEMKLFKTGNYMYAWIYICADECVPYVDEVVALAAMSREIVFLSLLERLNNSTMHAFRSLSFRYH